MGAGAPDLRRSWLAGTWSDRDMYTPRTPAAAAVAAVAERRPRSRASWFSYDLGLVMEYLGRPRFRTSLKRATIGASGAASNRAGLHGGLKARNCEQGVQHRNLACGAQLDGSVCCRRSTWRAWCRITRARLHNDSRESLQTPPRERGTFGGLLDDKQSGAG